MDQLALLCTLHADGPRTLRFLREVGCNSMADLEQLPSEDLAGVLHMPPAAARRLSREASRLGARLDSVLEPEEVTYPAASALLERRGDVMDLNLPEPRADSDVDAIQRLNLRDRDLLKRVVGSRKADVSTELPQPQSAPPTAPAVDSRIPSADQLSSGDLEGLDEELCSALAHSGIRSLSDLVECSVDDLVARIGIPFIQARSLQFRAGKRVGGGRPKLAVEAVVERLSPSDSLRPEPDAEPELLIETERSFIIPRPMPLDEGSAAGPFA